MLNRGGENGNLRIRRRLLKRYLFQTYFSELVYTGCFIAVM
jgi:hypothetical protein